MKSMNPMQNYPHIIQLLSCTLKIFAFMFLFPMNSLIFSEACSTPKLSNKQLQIFYKIRQSNVYQHLPNHQGLLHKYRFLLF